MRQYKYVIENYESDFRDAVVMTLRPKGTKDIFGFKPGQYVMLSFYNQAGKLFINHPFSIASSPLRSGSIRFGIKILGKFTQNLKKLIPGTEVEVLGPFGSFVFNEDRHQDVVFIAGGMGITPFISAIQYATDKGLANKINLIYSSRNLRDTLFYEDIRALALSNPNFIPLIKITDEVLIENSDYCENGYVTKDTILEKIGTLENKDFFLCGPPRFMKAMRENLKQLGVVEKRIHQETFNTTPDLSFRNNFKNIFLVYGFAAALFILFLGLIQTKTLSSTRAASYGSQIPLTLVNNVVNDRRNNIIGSKQLLSQTIGTVNTTTAPAIQSTINTPVQNPVNIPAPRTRVS